MSDEVLKKRILDAAETCVLQSGTGSRIHRLVAERAGVSRPTVYKYVGDQRAIIAALLHREVDRYLDAVQPVLSRGGTLREQFLDTVVFSVTYVRAHTLLQTLLREQPDAVLPWLTTRAESGLRRALASMTGYVAQVPRQPHEPRIQPAVVVEWAIRLALSLITTPSITERLDTSDDLRRYIASLLDIGSAVGTMPAKVTA